MGSQEKEKQQRETPGGFSSCISENMTPFALLKATSRLVGGGGAADRRRMRWLTGKISPALTVWVLKAISAIVQSCQKSLSDQ